MTEPIRDPAKPWRPSTTVWLSLLVAVVAIGVLSLPLILAAADEEAGTGTPLPVTTPLTGTGPVAQPPTATTIDPPVSTTPAVTVPAPGAGEGVIAVKERNILPLLGGSLARFSKTQVTGTAVRVFSLVGRAAFWAGPSRKQRLLVRIKLKGQPPPRVLAGQKVDFIGELTPNPPNAAAVFGVRGEDEKLLSIQGHYALVSIGDLR